MGPVLRLAIRIVFRKLMIFLWNQKSVPINLYQHPQAGVGNNVMQYNTSLAINDFYCAWEKINYWNYLK